MGTNLSRSHRDSLYNEHAYQVDELIHIFFLVRTLRTQLQELTLPQTKLEKELFGYIQYKIPVWIRELGVIDAYSDLVGMLVRGSTVEDEHWRYLDSDLRVLHNQMIQAHHVFVRLADLNRDRYVAILDVIDRFIAVL